MRDIPTVAVSSRDHKLASLLFDYIVPTHSSDTVPKEVRFEHPSLVAFGETEGVDLQQDLSYARGIVQTHTNSWIRNVVAEVPSDSLAKLRSKGLNDEQVAASEVFVNYVRNRDTEAIHEILLKNGIRSVPVFRSSAAYDTFLGVVPNPVEEISTNAVEISLLNAPLIDTANLEWDNILAMRRDKAFTRNLRNFRLFINENYSGKTSGEIQDDLNRKLEEYENSCRENGIRLVLGTLYQMLDSRCLLSALGVTAFGILTGNPAGGANWRNRS